MVFHLESPILKYHQKSSNSFWIIGEDRYVNALENFIELSLILNTDIFRNRIDFAYDIVKNKLCHKGEQHLRYNLNKWGKRMPSIS